MIEFPQVKVLMACVLALVILLIVRGMLKRDKMATSHINLEDLLLGADGKLSKAAAVMMGAFAVTTWIVIYLTLTGKITEGYVGLYGGFWIIPTVAKLIKGSPPASVQETSTMSTTKTITPTPTE